MASLAGYGRRLEQTDELENKLYSVFRKNYRGLRKAIQDRKILNKKGSLVQILNPSASRKTSSQSKEETLCLTVKTSERFTFMTCRHI